MRAKILVIEDEPTLARLLSYNLKQEGYEVTAIEHGGEGLKAALKQSYDLILLDIMLPGLNGFEIVDKLRGEGNKTPIIILTARDAEQEVVQGLKKGADDYMTKPFGVAELLARVDAVIRRTQSDDRVTTNEDIEEEHIALGPLVIYPDKYEVYVEGKLVRLRPKEFEVLLQLARRPGTVMTRDDLMNTVWGFDYIGGERTVDVHVSSLRKKLELNQDVVTIDSIRGVGYKLFVSN